MAFQRVLSCANLIPRFTLPNGQHAVNVLGFRALDGHVTEENLNELIDLYIDWHAEFLDTQQSANVSLTRVTGRDLDDEGSFVVVRDVIPPQVGANGAAVMPSNVSACIKFGTGRAGRAHRGRVYHVGLTETMVANDFVVSGTLDALVAMYIELKEAAALIGWDHVVISRVLDGVPRGLGVATTVSEYNAVTERVASQRRRLPGAGT